MATIYTARPVAVTDPSKGWRYGTIGVFRVENGSEEQIGEYVRNYGTFFDTFFPFELNGKQLALYSSHYTATRIMELPSCKDLGGEDPHDMGFCPIDYFVPTFVDLEHVTTSTNPAFPKERKSIHRVNNPAHRLETPTHEHTYTDLNTNQEYRDTSTSRPIAPVAHYDFGFVSGCIWGDDSTYKVQYLDLSEADRGVLKRDDRFGYVEIPDNVRLSEIINMEDYLYCDVNEDPDAGHIRISTLQTFDLKTGKLIAR